jgi:hypothetical protein
MDEKPLPIIDAPQEAVLKELQRELWKNAAVIHNNTFKVVEGGMVAIIQHSPGFKKLACGFDGPAEKISIQDIQELRTKLYLIFKNEKPSFLVYGGKKSSRVDDDLVKIAYDQIQSEGQFMSFSKEMEKIIEQGNDKGVSST